MVAEVGPLAKQDCGKLQGLVMPAGALVVAGKSVERAEGIMLTGAWQLEKIEQAARPVEVRRVHFPVGHTRPCPGVVGRDVVRLLKEQVGLPKGRDLLELLRHPHAQPGVAWEPLQGGGAKLGRLVELAECEELAVGRESRVGRGLALIPLQSARRLELPGLLVRVGTGDKMPAARRAFVDDPLAPQRDHRDEHDDDPKSGVVRLQRADSVTGRAGGRAHGDVLFAVIVGANPINRHGHGWEPTSRDRAESKQAEPPSAPGPRYRIRPPESVFPGHDLS
jgi:hypothetical protein